jgi:hypothetical protein
MTEAELNINIQSDQGKAEYQRSIQQAQQIRALAEAEAEKIARIGIAQALATEEQVRAYGGPQFQVTQTGAEALCGSHSAIGRGHCPARVPPASSATAGVTITAIPREPLFFK